MSDEYAVARSIGKLLHEIVVPGARTSLADGEQERFERELAVGFEMLDEMIESMPADPYPGRRT